MSRYAERGGGEVTVVPADTAAIGIARQANLAVPNEPPPEGVIHFHPDQAGEDAGDRRSGDWLCCCAGQQLCRRERRDRPGKRAFDRISAEIG